MTLKNYFIIILLVVLFTGCGNRVTYTQTEMVEGVVTLDGVPVEGAEVTFYPATVGSGESAMGKTDATGKYRLSSMKGKPEGGTTIGEYGVTVSKWVTRKLDKPIVDYAQDATITTESKELMPIAYTDIEFSPLKATVAAGMNTINLELDSKAVPSRKKK